MFISSPSSAFVEVMCHAVSRLGECWFLHKNNFQLVLYSLYVHRKAKKRCLTNTCETFSPETMTCPDNMCLVTMLIVHIRMQMVSFQNDFHCFPHFFLILWPTQTKNPPNPRMTKCKWGLPFLVTIFAMVINAHLIDLNWLGLIWIDTHL